MRGIIASLFSGKATVSFENRIIPCHIKKNLPGLQINDICVGDWVEFEMASANEGIIFGLHPRRSILKRPHGFGEDPTPIAANIDGILGVFSFRCPEYRLGFVDRMAIMAHHFALPLTLVFNKLDLLENPNDPELATLSYYDHALGIKLFLISLFSGKGVEELKQYLDNKTVVLFGHSGVGKSSLINTITGADQQKTHTLNRDQKGTHTTKTPVLYPFRSGGLIDTPGVRLLASVPIRREQLKNYYPDFFSLSQECRLTSCHHIVEPDCAVEKGVERGLLPPHRLLHYRKLFEELRHLEDQGEFWRRERPRKKRRPGQSSKDPELAPF